MIEMQYFIGLFFIFKFNAGERSTRLVECRFCLAILYLNLMYILHHMLSDYPGSF
jgi:hypothetical protein